MKKGKGTGHGTAVVHDIVKSYGGLVYVQRRPGEGSTFELLIPAFAHRRWRIHDLVITDMTTPKRSGFDLAEKILEIRSDFPIILCIGFSVDIKEEQIFNYGVRGIIYKPVPRRDLTAMIRKTIDGS